ncbi:MAG: NAD(P)-binding domain-containing protein [Acidimicrobiia bacterium]|nr:NAD(P)-binding domain-containing protein [Acidimicrobiia bacterium]
MQIAVLGTGPVGQSLAAKLASLGHQVTIGTRDVEATMGRTEPDSFGNPPFSEWAAQHTNIAVATFAEAAAGAAWVVNATNGAGSIAALEAAGETSLAGKVLVDVANPLDFSQGMPPALLVSNTDSLGEQIQRRFPDARVVKTFNTMNAYLMVDPTLVAGGDHTVFVSGDDQDAKAAVTELLESFGWSDIVDLGDITTARGSEMLLPIWVRLWSALGNPMFQFKIAR